VLLVERGTSAFDVQSPEGRGGEITLDSQAGVEMCPGGMSLRLARLALKKTAAKGVEILSKGVEIVDFVGKGRLSTFHV
jgi:hypothetical protein